MIPMIGVGPDHYDDSDVIEEVGPDHYDDSDELPEIGMIPMIDSDDESRDAARIDWED
jgi:hypothetical protein